MSDLNVIVRIWIFLVGSTCLGGVAQAHDTLPDMLEKVRASVVAVGTYDPTGRPRQVFRGSGFVVGNGHQVITNHHVLPGALKKKSRETLAIFSGRGKQVRYHEARLLAKDVANDLALLYISTPLPAMKLGSAGRVREGDEVAFTGFPLGMVLGLYPVTHSGIVSAITPMAQPQISSRVITPKMIRAMRNGSKVLQLDAIAYPGNSGSAVYSPDDGEVIGVVNSVVVKGNKEAAIQKPSGITYAIDVKHVRKLLEQAGN